MSESRLTRRDLLRVSAIATGAAVASACAGAPAPTTAPAPVEATTAPEPTAAPAEATTAPVEAPPSRYNEAPMLAEMVKAGTLPPVEERLPKEPLVVPVIEEIGQYGGIWDMAVTGQADLNGAMGYQIEPWILYNAAGDAWSPNLAKAVEISPDGSEFTFHMREGMKWSDGEPFTADDVLFWYEDLVLNDELSPSKPGWLKSEGELAVITKVDDYTFKVTFAKPAGLFLPYIAYVWGTRDMWAPKHYLMQFHPKYADADELAAKVKEAGFETWVQLMGDRRQERMNPDVPVIYAWKLKELGPPWIFERNPYFYKVDPEGNQLPYIDTIRASAVENAQMISMKALAGELSYQARNIAFSDMPLYMDNREKGDYRVIKKMGENVGFTIFPNQTLVGDDGMLALIKDIRFRKALNLAIDRDELNELIYLGERTDIPAIFPLLEGESELFEHLTLDVDAANALLDEMGLEMGADGVRLRPDGGQLIIKLDMFSSKELMDAAELVTNYWTAIGVKTSPEEVSYDLWWPRIYSHEYAFCGYVKDGLQKLACYVYLRSYAPVDHSTYWAPAWGQWYQTGGLEGVEPDHEDARKGQLLFDEAKVTVDTNKLLDILAEIQRLDLRNIWEVLTVGAGPGITIVKNNFRNVPEVPFSLLHDSDNWAEQYFIKG
ncbi:MAG: ABC transporter substrate-binding protein [Anaerolineae bacterium]|nr:ABC transporter substrate-binding protein [Anaerolineae bacterium]